MLMLYSSSRLFSKQITRSLLSSSVKRGQRFVHSPSPDSLTGQTVKYERNLSQAKLLLQNAREKDPFGVIYPDAFLAAYEKWLKEAEEEFGKHMAFMTKRLFRSVAEAQFQICIEDSKRGEFSEGLSNFKPKYEGSEPIKETNIFGLEPEIDSERESILSSHTLAYWTLAAEKSLETRPGALYQKEINDVKSSFKRLNGYNLEDAFDHKNYEMVLKPRFEFEGEGTECQGKEGAVESYRHRFGL